MISTNITNNIALDLRELIIKRDESMRNFLPEDSVIIASLLHDVCKADIYKPTIKKQKNSRGVWRDLPSYDVDYSNFPLEVTEKNL